MLSFVWIDRLENKELSLLLDMNNRIIAEDNNNGFTNKRQIDDYNFVQLRNDVHAGLKRLLIIKEESVYRGQVIINMFHQDTYKHRCDISSLMLERSARSKEVSLKIAESLIVKCEELNLELVTIDVRASSGPEKLWHYLGFKPFGNMPKYAKVKDQYYSGTFMYQEVDQMKVLLMRRLAAIYLN